MLKIDRVEVDYAFPLTEVQVGKVVTAVGNSEAKAAAFGVLRDNFIYNQKGLHGEVLRVQGENPGWKISEGGPFSSCNTLPYKRGFVQRVYLDREEIVYGLQITPSGLGIGVAVIGNLLDLSRRYEPALVELCGGSHMWTPEAVYNHKPDSEIDFENKTNAALKISVVSSAPLQHIR